MIFLKGIDVEHTGILSHSSIVFIEQDSRADKEARGALTFLLPGQGRVFSTANRHTIQIFSASSSINQSINYE
ncbi:hypothetical protein [Commensalibacter sp. Nvir]|uniref:hypothetical protein n=1 Tax=Commensalibacter sp. Nvir TaxID=3069817 RepID=UPI0030C80249